MARTGVMAYLSSPDEPTPRAARPRPLPLFGASAPRVSTAAAAALVACAAAALAALIPDNVLPDWPSRAVAGVVAVCVATAVARGILALGRRILEAAVWAARLAIRVAARAVAFLAGVVGLLAARVPRGSTWMVSGVIATALIAGGLGRFSATAFTVLDPVSVELVGVGVGLAAAAVVIAGSVGLALALRRRVLPALAAFVAAGTVIAAALYPTFARRDPPAGTFTPAPHVALGLEDPTRPGPYAVREVRYGVGDDLRPRYGSGVELRTARLDASTTLRGWTPERSRRFGFGPDALPINGRAWLPSGSGPFPLVLLVHGLAETALDSEEGFAYLGELLASRGHVVAAIDKNFLVNGRHRLGRLAGDEEVRAALALAHLDQWARFTRDDGGPAAGLVDLGNVALVGHSRGGEAVKVALAMNEAGLFGGPFGIRAVVALAPTANLGGGAVRASYLVMHGDQDNDVEAFLGRRAYHAVQLGGPKEPGSPLRVKAAVYVRGANHAQFNAAWGEGDLPWPSRLLERTHELLPAQAQRRVTALYVSAFLDATLRGSSGARRLLQDVRAARALVPYVELSTKYLDSESDLLCSFDEDEDRHTATVRGALLTAHGFGTWSEHDLPLRLGRRFGSRENRLLDLRWERAPGAPPPRLSLVFPDGPPRPWGLRGALTFALGFPARAAGVTVRVIDVRDEAAAMPLSRVFPVAPARPTKLTRAGVLEEASSEVMLQTVVVPLADLVRTNPRLDLAEVRRIDLLFEAPSGTAYVDDIAYTPRDGALSGAAPATGSGRAARALPRTGSGGARRRAPRPIRVRGGSAPRRRAGRSGPGSSR